MRKNITYLFRILLFAITFSANSSIYAQNNNQTDKSVQATKNISGTVVDSNGEELPGVAVFPPGHEALGTATDSHGNFVLKNIPKGINSIRFSFLGMQTQNVSVKGKTFLKVVMQEDAMSIKDVVVTGYQIIDRRYSTSATTSVKMEDINVPGVTNLTQMLEGKIPDMAFISNSGEINATPKLRIRGTSTLIGNREPLWVLDGVVLNDPVNLSPDVLNDPDYVNRIGNAISGINPQDIERIDVLKDAAATALYGTRAANGVIVITTKSGRVGKPVVGYSATMTVRKRPYYTDSKIDLMNSADRIQFSKDLVDMHYYYPSNMPLVGYEYALQEYYAGRYTQNQFNSAVEQMAETNTDWFDILSHNSFSHDHTVSVSGGSDDVRYYISVGYTNQDDVMKFNTNRRYSAHARVDMKLSSKLNLEFNANGYVNDKKYNQDEANPVNYAYNTSRAIPAYNSDGSYHFYGKYNSSSSIVSENDSYLNYNILNELENSYNKQSIGDVIATLNLRYKPMQELSFNAIVSATYSSSKQEAYWGEKSFHAAQLRTSNYGETPSDPVRSVMPYGGELTTSNYHNKGMTARVQGTYNKYFGDNEQHNINIVLGGEASSTRYDGQSRTDRGYFPERGKTFAYDIPETYTAYMQWLRGNVPVMTDRRTNLLSAYGTATYSLANYFTVNANARYDGSNQFGSRSNEKLLPIWSTSGNAKLKEIFNIKADWIDYLTLKASYGEQGNMLDGQTTKLVIKKGSMNAYYDEFVSNVSAFANPDLKWEKTHSTNVGLETSFLGGRLQFGIEGYYKRTTDAFMNKTISDINGYTSYVVNSGTVINKGYNITVSATPVKTKDFYWIFSGNLSKIINKVNTAPGQETYKLSDFLNGTAIVAGQPVGTFYSYKFIGLSPADGGPLFDDKREQLSEISKMGEYDAYTTVLVPSGKREPDITGSINNTFTYKQWRLGVMLTYNFGAKTRLFRLFDDLSNSGYSSEANVSNTLLNRWRQPGDEYITDIPAIISSGNPNYSYYNDSWDTNTDYTGPDLGNNAWEMYDYSTARVVSADYMKISNIQLTYEFNSNQLKKLGLGRLAITASGMNLYTFCNKRLKGQTPTQGGFSDIQLSDTPSYTLGLTIEF